MDRTIVLNEPVAIAQGHRVEVVESAASAADAVRVYALIDLDTGIEYVFSESHSEDATVWTGRVRRCTVAFTGSAAAHTTLVIDPITPAAASAKAALRGADAAAEAARAEAGRWGGSDRMPAKEPEPFW